MRHRLTVLYASGSVKADMRFEAQTAFYPIGWAMQEVWRRMARDLGDSTISDDNFLLYYNLLERAKLLLPDGVWKFFFANDRHLKAFPIYSASRPALPLPTIIATYESTDAPANSEGAIQVLENSAVDNTDTTLRNRSTRLLKTPDLPAADEAVALQDLSASSSSSVPGDWVMYPDTTALI